MDVKFQGKAIINLGAIIQQDNLAMIQLSIAYEVL